MICLVGVAWSFNCHSGSLSDDDGPGMRQHLLPPEASMLCSRNRRLGLAVEGNLTMLLTDHSIIRNVVNLAARS